MWFPIFINGIISGCMGVATTRLIPPLIPMFLKANLFGVDRNKKSGNKVPEAFGVVAGCMFLITLFMFIPVPFGTALFHDADFPHDEFVKLVSALLSICCMLLLGFADDVLDLRWRHKLFLPMMASLPLLMVYYVSFNVTNVIVPKPLRMWLGFTIDLGVLYYIYMGMLAIFCTNAINILAGVNGLEVGQSVVIGLSILLFNLCELGGPLWRTHQFSIFFILPFVSTSLALLKYNWYPSRVFVGDTFCYFAGMTFAVVGILGHFSKTVLLFFIPQVINFIYSLPQLFHIIPCPRHRMPILGKDGLLLASKVSFPANDMKPLPALIVKFLAVTRLAEVRVEGDSIHMNNLTLINLVLVKLGQLHEQHLTTILLFIQVISSGLAFLIRYPLASVFYDVSSTHDEL